MQNNLQFTLTLVRHGESEVNATPDVMGQAPETKLTMLGKQQAALLRKKFIKDNEKFDLIFSSPYERALDTAKMAIGDMSQKIILVDDLREYNAGDWNGASRSATMTDEIRLCMGYLDNTYLPPHGESLHMVERRASKWLEDVIIYNESMWEISDYRALTEKPPLNIVAFSHGMTIKCLLHYVMGFDKSLTWKISIDNTSITKLSFGKEGWRLHKINDCSHFYL